MRKNSLHVNIQREIKGKYRSRTIKSHCSPEKDPRGNILYGREVHFKEIRSKLKARWST